MSFIEENQSVIRITFIYTILYSRCYHNWFLDFWNMETFIEFKRIFLLLGIKADGKCNFNIKNILIIFLDAICFVGMSAFVLLENESLTDMENSFYGATCTAINITSYSNSIVKRQKIFDLIIRFENIINNSKFQPTFS